MKKLVHWILVLAGFVSVSINLKVSISLLNPVSGAAAESVQGEKAKLASSLPRSSTTQRDETPKAVTPALSRTLPDAVADNAQAPTERTVTFDDLPLLEDPVTGLDLSRDGSLIAIAHRETLFVLERKSGKVVHDLGDGKFPVWSPSGSKLAFYSKRSGEMQLWIWNSQSRRTSQLTQVKGGIDPDPGTRVAGHEEDSFKITWSPDEGRIAFASRVPAAASEGPRIDDYANEMEGVSAPLMLTNSTPGEWTLRGVFTHETASAYVNKSKLNRLKSAPPRAAGGVLYSQLFMVGLADGATTQLTKGAASSFHPAWSPSGQSLACVTIDQASLGFTVPSSDLTLIDVSTSDRKILITDHGVISKPKWSPSGSEIAYLQSAAVYVRPDLKLASLSAKIATLAAHIDRFIYDYSWRRTESGFIVLYKDGLRGRLGRVDADPAKIIEVTPAIDGPRSIASFAVADNDLIVWHQYDPAALTTLQYIVSPYTFPPKVIDLSPSFNRASLSRVEVVRWRNSRGELMEGTLLTPPPRQNARRPFPMIVDAYPMQGGSDWSSPMGGNYAWASNGYAVFRPSPRAPNAWINSWTTEAWSAAGKGSDGWGVMVDDVLSGVNTLVERGVVDQHRMCLYGHSNGAGVVNYLVTKTDRFRCAISVAPAFSNWVRRAQLTTGDSIGPYADGITIDDQLDEYIKLSAVFHLSSVKTPMLLAVGDADSRDTVLDSIEMFSGLRRLGKQVILLRYPDEGHVFYGAALRDLWNRETAFFDQHLKE